MRRRTLAGLGGITAIALGLGWLLSLATTRVVNWFVMTDELYYERLAISVAQTGSLLPRIRGEAVGNVNQLYPVLISTVFGDGDVPASLQDAHRLNAFLIVSAAVPVYLLARLVGLRLVTSLWVGALAVAVPWVVLASFLLTEAVAYPAFCWGVLAVTHAVLRRSVGADLIAVAAIGLAVLARVQFALLAVVLVLAVVWDALLVQAAEGARGRLLLRRAGSRLLGAHRVLAGLVAAGGVVLVVAALTGGVSRLLGAYSVTASGLRLDLGFLELFLEHAATLALGLALLPFLLGVGWLLDRARPAAADPQRGFALVGLLTLLLLVAQVASFDQRFGAGLVKDRYLFYVVPVVLVALAAVVDRCQWPTWWALLVPAAVAAVGFATLELPRYVKLNVDSVLAMLNDGLVGLASSPGWARALLVLAVVVSLQLLLVLRLLVPARVLAVAVALIATTVLPLETAYAFERLFRVDGTNGLPVTLDQGVVFNWVDRNVGRDGRVLMVRYPLYGPDVWADQGYWWDAEFWNESVVERFDAHGQNWAARFDPDTGAMLEPGGSRYAIVATPDVRFRLAGEQVTTDRGAYLFELASPPRAAWITHGIHGDGWMRPHVPATIVVYPEPGQKQALVRFVTLGLQAPGAGEPWPVRIASNRETIDATVAPDRALDRLITVCVPPGRSEQVTITTPRVATMHRDPTAGAFSGEIDRPVGLLLRSVALAGETVPVARCSVEDGVG